MRTNHILKTTASWRYCLGAPFLTMHGALLTQPTTRITPCSPPLRQTGALARSAVAIPTSTYHVPYIRSLGLQSFPQDALERLFLRRCCHRLYERERFQLRCPHECDRYDTRPAQPGALRSLHGAKHVRGRRGWRTSLRRIRYEHQLYRGGRAASGKPHPAEQDGALVRPA